MPPSLAATSIEQVLAGRIPGGVRRVLDVALSCAGGGAAAVSREDGALLLAQRDSGAVGAIAATADELRRRRNGDFATYVVNRNIQFTNVCVKRCGFCAFSRTVTRKRDGNTSWSGLGSSGHEEGYFMPISEVVRRAQEAVELGATEICVQAGLPPAMQPDLYEETARSIKEAAPGVHLHAFSPEEVLYGARTSRRTVREMLVALREAGVNSLPGTSAEILDDALRHRLAAARLSSDEWREVIETAHEEGIPTTSTMMYGHVEGPADVAGHLDTLREVQKRALAHGGPGRLTEFVPLSFVAAEAPMYRDGKLPGCRAGPSGVEVVLAHAVSRIMLDGLVNNIQVSWVKEGPRMAQLLLQAGVNDLGGTLINESISTAAGSRHGQRISPKELRALARGAGRTPAQRSTTYGLLERFPSAEEEAACASSAAFCPPSSSSSAPAPSSDSTGTTVGTGGPDGEGPFSTWTGGDERFGSYHELTRSTRWRFRDEVKLRRDRRPSAASPLVQGQSPTGPRVSLSPAMAASSSRGFSTSVGASLGAAAASAAAAPKAPDAAVVVTYSPSYTIVPTFECFNSCAYCNFRARRGEPRAEWLSLDTARRKLEALRESSEVREILILGGEVHPGSRRRTAWLQLAVDLCDLSRQLGFLPHTNIGPLTREEMARLSASNASMGLMLEQMSERVFRDRDGPYARGAPSKAPALRLQQLEFAGELRVPFTTGLLVGIGETEAELEATVDAIANTQRRFGNIQECIVQPYRPGSRDTWAPDAPYDLDRLPAAVALARAKLPSEVVVQVPPNLVSERPDVLLACLEAGARDLGGISPRDEVNPDYDFPTVGGLASTLLGWGYALEPREAVHDRLASWAFAGRGLRSLSPSPTAPAPALRPLSSSSLGRTASHSSRVGAAT